MLNAVLTELWLVNLENSLLPDLLQEKWLSTIEENGKNPSQSSKATSISH